MQRITVRSRYDNSTEKSLLKSLQALGAVTSLKLSRVYWLVETTPGCSKELDLPSILGKVFFDPISEDMTLEYPKFQPTTNYAEVRFLAGVTDNVARSATEALMLFSNSTASWQDFSLQAHSGWQLEVDGDISEDLLKKVIFHNLANPLLNKVDISRGESLLVNNTWARYEASWSVAAPAKKELLLLPLQTTILEKINKERGLALSAEEIQTIILHYSSNDIHAQRKALGWEDAITEVELECLAQTWSEHCKHKIFAADVTYTEDSGAFPALGSRNIQSLYKSYIQKATKDLSHCDYLVSVFKDNAGIVDFDKNLNICVKVETHNSPSALDPFGGAITGILGVNRDILGCGLGAKPIANMDVFCLSQKDLFPGTDSPKRPELLKDPSLIFKGVHQGVEEGGNQSGIPTVNGAFYFASEFAAKPLIFVGSLGVLPKTVHGRPSEEKVIHAGDLIIVAGGRLGKDGVHGATFSSLALHDQVSSNVVQIGDSITQKRLLDFTLVARDNGWIQAITDNGAGGVSSSIGEMAQYSGGAYMDLKNHPVKYAGLEFWEMLISESQERMSYAVKPENKDKFLKLAQAMGVEASVLGEFNSSGFFDVVYGEKPLAKIELTFLHDGLSKMKIPAHFEGPKAYQEFHRALPKKNLIAKSGDSLLTALKTVLASPNVASREPLVRYYDHEVQGATRVKPYAGETQQGANNAGVLDLSVHGGQEGNAVAVSNGLCPQYSCYDTYLMAQKAVDESVRNLIATGADPDRLALVDNFCWPDPIEKASNPDAKHKMAQLVRACAGLYDSAMIFNAPFVSGKDSMKNDFIGKMKGGDTVKISVPPTVLVTAIGQVPNSSNTAPGFFQKADQLIYTLGKPSESLFASALAQQFSVVEEAPEYPDLRGNKTLYGKIYQAHQHRWLSSCHDISEGGLMSALAEACFGNTVGCDLDLQLWSWNQLWSETCSLFVVSVNKEHQQQFEKHFAGDFIYLGVTTVEPKMTCHFADQKVLCEIQELQTIWSQGVVHVYET